MTQIIHPTKEEYAMMDKIRFPFMYEKKNMIEEAKYQKYERFKKVKFGNKARYKLEERIKALIIENKEKFFDPRISEEIFPISKKDNGGWAKDGQVGIGKNQTIMYKMR